MKINVLPIIAGALGSLALAISASGDFLYADIQELDLGAPDGFVTYRVVAHFDGPDVVLAWGALPDIGELHFFTGNDVDLLNAGGDFDGLPAEDFAAFPISEAYDSWLTVGATEFAGNNTAFTIGFLGGGDGGNIVKGHEFSETDGLVYNAEPNHPWFGPEVVLAQFTIPGIPGGQPGDKGHNGFHLEGVVAWWNSPLTGDFNGPFNVDLFVVDNIVPAPGALALLGLVGLTGAVRRRREGTAPSVA